MDSNCKNPTRHTLERAKYHVSKMKEAFQDDGEFSFNLDGFLEAAREVPWHMKKQYDKEPGFNQWYDEKVAEMQKMPMLRFTIKARNYSTKEGPVPVGATCEISLSTNATIVANGLKTNTNVCVVPTENGENGLKASGKSRIETVNRWFWDVGRYMDKGDKCHVPQFEKGSVLETCENILKYLDELVEECEKEFASC